MLLVTSPWRVKHDVERFGIVHLVRSAILNVRRGEVVSAIAQKPQFTVAIPMGRASLEQAQAEARDGLVGRGAAMAELHAAPIRAQRGSVAGLEKASHRRHAGSLRHLLHVTSTGVSAYL